MNVVGGVLILQSLAEVFDKLLGSRVNSHERKRSITCDGRDVDNKSSSLGNHKWKDCSSDHDSGRNVDLDMLHDAFLVLIQESIGRLMHDSCIVDQDSNVSSGSFDLSGQVCI